MTIAFGPLRRQDVIDFKLEGMLAAMYEHALAHLRSKFEPLGDTKADGVDNPLLQAKGEASITRMPSMNTAVRRSKNVQHGASKFLKSAHAVAVESSLGKALHLGEGSRKRSKSKDSPRDSHSSIERLFKTAAPTAEVAMGEGDGSATINRRSTHGEL